TKKERSLVRTGPVLRRGYSIGTHTPERSCLGRLVAGAIRTSGSPTAPAQGFEGGALGRAAPTRSAGGPDGSSGAALQGPRGAARWRIRWRRVKAVCFGRGSGWRAHVPAADPPLGLGRGGLQSITHSWALENLEVRGTQQD